MDVLAVVETSELWLTPLILLPGVALLIGSTAGRFGQVHTEFHHLIDHPDDHAKIVARSLVLRSRLFRNALLGLYASVAMLALGSFAGGLVNHWRPQALWLTGAFTMAGILLVLYAAIQLVREALTCMKVVAEHGERVYEALGSGRGEEAS
jgi:hypothetical protein